jgi:magnesium-transporting ATPase (P-type)
VAPPAQESTVGAGAQIDPTVQIDLVMRDLRASPTGLSVAEARRRQAQYGPNELRRQQGHPWARELGRQLTHPLALLLWLAAILSFAVGSHTVAYAVLLVIILNAAFAFVQEMQADRAVEALAQFLPQRVSVLREGDPAVILASELVPGDVVLVEEGDRIAADMRLISGAVEVDLSALTGESAPALRSAELIDVGVPRSPRETCSSAAPAAPVDKLEASSSPRRCTPSLDASPRSRSGSRTSRVRWRRRCAESHG